MRALPVLALSTGSAAHPPGGGPKPDSKGQLHGGHGEGEERSLRQDPRGWHHLPEPHHQREPQSHLEWTLRGIDLCEVHGSSTHMLKLWGLDFVFFSMTQVILTQLPGQEIQFELFDKDIDQDDFLGRWPLSTSITNLALKRFFC